jgi:hypothetical protein
MNSTVKFKDFTKIWRGGYYEGDPLDPTSGSSYGAFGYNSVLYTIYLTCIKPYVTPQTVVLEIGPGRGAWTKTFLHLGAKEIWCLDAAPAEHTGFYEYAGTHKSVRYLCVKDALLNEIENNSIDYFFSFGVFCHCPQDVIKTYLHSLSSKMKIGSHGFFMIADFDKLNNCIDKSITIFNNRSKRWILPFWGLWNVLKVVLPSKYRYKKESEEDTLHRGLGRWYNLSTDSACAILESCGFTVVDRDMNVCQRDPVIHFMRPSPQ